MLQFRISLPFLLLMAFSLWIIALFLSSAILDGIISGLSQDKAGIFSLHVVDDEDINPGRIIERPRGVFQSKNSSQASGLMTAWQRVPFQSDPALPRILSREQTEITLQLVRNVTSLFRHIGVEYVMCMGTLLGSYVSHAILAWDDDIELFIHQQHIPNLIEASEKGLLPRYGLGFTESCQGREKLTNACILPKYKLWWLHSPWKSWTRWLMPFIDIATYGSNSTHVWLFDPQPWMFPTDAFYPLQLRPLNGLWLPAPREPYAILSAHYRDWREEHAMVCKLPGWDHWTEKRRPVQLQSDCKDLTVAYPFVHRIKVPGGVREELRVNGVTYYSIISKETFMREWQPEIYDLIWLPHWPRVCHAGLLHRLKDNNMQHRTI